MVVNDVPGEECRIALVENGQLEELYTERIATATNVGNIYKGRVVNVEAAIQAAFIDYGAGQNGFLHISDLHPRYFPKGDKTEQVGKKVPRRERPPIQEALRRGNDILVQVIKEGIGTKGPTLTSYLSVPGRLMVMMPHMDKVGVSRKIDDEEKRREMRKALDALDLPEGLGFILRTAGFGRTKTELKRDLAFLKRLWTQMEKRIKKHPAPCPLYAESDLLIRTIRDVMSAQIACVIVDSKSAYRRATEFLRVIAPRSAPKVIRYTRRTPIFHAFDVERQIDLIHQREVPLPSGGAIVIDQTEALVAIDVNSGKSRSARDSETNALETNKEACDEICRQLRLRDLGGLVINDMIDMVRLDNRKTIEQRFRDNLARDRARTSIARISEFGILEMTRQRMRPSMRKTHYQPCPHCEGRGEVRTPDSIAADALRHAAYLLHYDRIRTVEVVCSARVASSFLSTKRRELVRVEDMFDKKVRIRVSETIAQSRVDYYAYDERSADVDLTKLPAIIAPKVADLEKEWEKALAEADTKTQAETDVAAAEDRADASATHGRRMRRGRQVASFEEAMAAGDLKQELAAIDREEGAEAAGKAGDAPEAGRKKRRRRRKKTDTSAAEAAATPEPAAAEKDGAAEPTDTEGATSKKKKRRRRRRKKSAEASEGAAKPDTGASAPADDAGDHERKASATEAKTEPEDAEASASDDQEPSPRKKRRRRRRSRSKAGGESSAPSTPATPSDNAGAAASTEDAKEDAGSKKTGRRRRRRRGKSDAAVDAEGGRASAASPAHDEPKAHAPRNEKDAASKPQSGADDGATREEPAPPKGRPLYRAFRRVTSQEARAARKDAR